MRGQVEYRIVRPDGGVRWIWDHGFPVRDRAGEFSNYVGVAEDITEREEAKLRLEAVHTALQKEHAIVGAIYRAQTKFMTGASPLEIYNGLLDNLLMLSDSEYGFIDELNYTPDGYPYLVARAITDISWNDATRKMHGEFLSGNLKFSNMKSLFGEVMVTGKPVFANDPPHDPRRGGVPAGHPALKTFFWGVPLYSGQDFVGGVGLANRRAGYDAEMVEYLRPLLTACAHLIAARRSEQRRQEAEQAVRHLNADLEQRVRYRTEQLQASVKELEAFAYTVAHDLRAPLRAVHGFSSLLLEGHASQLDGEGRRLVDVVRGEAMRMGQLVDGLLDFFRVGRREMKPADVDMTALARDVFEAQAARVAGRHLQLRCDALAPARGDTGLLRLVFENLISNAIKFTEGRDPGVIEVGSRREEEQTVYFVRDNGAGFEMEYAHKLFGVFQRLHAPADFEGTGIGLALVQRAVERHGGHVWAEGKVNEGATFYFALPAEAEAGS